MQVNKYSVRFSFGAGNVITMGVVTNSETKAVSIAREFAPWIPVDAEAEVRPDSTYEVVTNMFHEE